ncbi:MAG: homoserine dehydrogenase, partial [Phycisphaeraceae bacterium]
EIYAERLGKPLEIARVLVRNAAAAREVDLPEDVLTDDPDVFFDDPRIAIVVEAAGGGDAVSALLRRALEKRLPLVTANKALLASQGSELFALARKHDVCIAFEASCGGGIPILAALKFGLSANRIKGVYGILNGTCNYILTQMGESGAAYTDALLEAQELGFAESDPTLDVSGADAAQKLAIIASLAFGLSIEEREVACQGIDDVRIDDIIYGSELGYVVKLLAVAERHNGGLVLRVAPCFVHTDEPLAQVRQSFNAISVFGHAVGHTMFYGRGAGQMPTASAVVSDLINVASGWYGQAFKQLQIWPDQNRHTDAIDPDQIQSRYYFRITTRDEPGGVARIAEALGEHGISISAILQHEGDDASWVPLVVTTHHAREGAVRRALEQIAQLNVVSGQPVSIRILDLPEG